MGVEVIFESLRAFCPNCGTSIQLTNTSQRFCSEKCKAEFDNQLASIRKKRRNAYQKQYRSTRYKTEVRHIKKILCSKCNEIGYLVRYTVKNRESGNTVSIYETVRHQVTINGKSILKNQCYIRSLSKDQETNILTTESNSEGNRPIS
ncbi:MAG: hypothetical protein ACYCQJ_03350 [Nitrososphaerales archaeon]